MPQDLTIFDSSQIVSGGSGGYIFMDRVITNVTNNDTSVLAQKLRVNGGQA